MYVTTSETGPLDYDRAKVEWQANRVQVHLHGHRGSPFLSLQLDEAEWLLPQLQAAVEAGRAAGLAARVSM